MFARHILGLEELQQVVVSRRCLGAASQKLQSCPRQADPFTVLQLKRLHEVLRDSDEVWDKAMAGMLLFASMGVRDGQMRNMLLRWSQTSIIVVSFSRWS